MITCLFVALFFGGVVVWTGPACDGWRERRVQKRNFPRAKAKFLLPSCVCGLCGGHECLR